MAPKKQKMTLGSFLGDEKLGSWADEMDSLPTAPAPKAEDDSFGSERDYGRRERDYGSSRPERSYPPRDELPLPTAPPYTAFVGNLPFDLTEGDLGDFFAPSEVKSVKVIHDREGKPKGFGYVEFGDLDGLKAGLAKSDSSFMNRTIRVSVAEPQKERSGGGFGGYDDEKFSGNWRRDGPLPDRGGDREGGRFGGDRDGGRFGDRDGGRGFGDRDGGRRRNEEPRETMSDNVNDWRSSKPAARVDSFGDSGAPRRRGSAFTTSSSQEGSVGLADSEETWSRGSRFKPAAQSPTDSLPGSRFGSLRGNRGDMGPPPAPGASDGESNWRRPSTTSQNSTSPTGSVPSTPQLARRKLDLLPRSGAPSVQASPLSSPKSASHNTAPRSNPFGAAKPVDVTAREAAALEKIEKEKEERAAHAAQAQTQHSMSRQSSRQARERPAPSGEGGWRTPPSGPKSSSASQTGSPEPEGKGSPSGSVPPSAPRAPSSTVRPTFSFAAAARKDTGSTVKPKEEESVVEVTEGVAEASLED